MLEDTTGLALLIGGFLFVSTLGILLILGLQSRRREERASWFVLALVGEIMVAVFEGCVF